MRLSESRGRFDIVRAAVDRVRSGRSTSEEIDLPSGDKVTIRRDQNAPAGVRIETPQGSGETREVVLPGLRERRGVPRPEADLDNFRSLTFEPSERRGPDYPDDLPFLPGCAASISTLVSEAGGAVARHAAWVRPLDPLGALADIKLHLRGMGWGECESTQASSYMGQTLSSRFVKGGKQRTVALMAFGDVCQIMLFEKREE